MKALSRADRIGVIVHGPEVVDSGSAEKVLSYLRRFGDVTALLGGTMGRLAIMDSGLGDIIKISPRRRPSQSIKDLRPSRDIMVILNQAKTRETGMAFGKMVVENSAAGSGDLRPIIHIDCGGKFVALFYGSREASRMAEAIAKDLGLEYLGHLPVVQDAGEHGIMHDGDAVIRRLTGVLPGELISINGTVVARATGASGAPVEIKAKNGFIVEIKGAEPKPHGLEKLSKINLEEALIRSGNIRRTKARPGELICRGEGAALIDHNAEDTFEAAEGACIVVTVGDDTTAIAGDILSRLGITVIGIVDGDIDGLSRSTMMPKGSMIITVQPGFDDVIGRQVKEEIFHGKNAARIKASELKDRVQKIAGERAVSIDRV